MRKPLIAGNWKMNTTVTEAVKLVSEMQPLLEPLSVVEKVVCPPFVSLVAVRQVLKGSSIKLGAQNMHFEEKGAYTGEVSPLMLAGVCEYVILGHSERRQYFHETNESVNRKIRAAQKAGLKPILCVGENLSEHDAGKTAEIVVSQVKESLQNILIADSLVIAYEPVWAIGTGQAATGLQANDVIGLIRKTAAGMSGVSTAEKMRILYGGSVTGDNIAEFVREPEIDGALVGGASLKVDQFVSIVRQTAQIRQA